MYPTMELRWFIAGDLPANMLEWLCQKGRIPEMQPARVDYYLRLTEGNESLGIKLREGKVEVKQCYRQIGPTRFDDRVAGWVEQWQKWSFDLIEAERQIGRLVRPETDWIEVQKERQLVTFSRLANEIRPAAAIDEPGQGCDLELSRVAAAGKVWWSLCFEAFDIAAVASPETTLEATLFQTVRYVLTGNSVPIPLEADHSYGYPKWLKGLGR